MRCGRGAAEELIVRRGRGEWRKRSGNPHSAPLNSLEELSDATAIWIRLFKQCPTSTGSMTSKECGSNLLRTRFEELDSLCAL